MICVFRSIALDKSLLSSSKYIMKHVQLFLSVTFGLQQNTEKYRLLKIIHLSQDSVD